MNRRDFLALTAAGGGAVLASSLTGCMTARAATANEQKDFYFVQLSDTHWGFQGPPNPDAQVTLRKAVAAVNALSTQPEFIVFTGDLTHTTDDPAERRRRMVEFKTIVGELKVKNVRFMPGEHDASLDRGAAFKELFGETFYTFDHKHVHFIAIDNVSDPGAKIGDEQLAWLQADLEKRDKAAPIVVLTHRPLFDLAPKMGLGHARRRPGHRVADAVQECNGVLWPHPPRASSHDWTYRAPFRQVVNLSVTRARIARKTNAVTVGSRGAIQRPRFP